MSKFPGRPPRLPREAYLGEKTVAVTACLCTRHPFFSTPQVVTRFVELLRRGCVKGRCIAPIYCFMPDHLHFMLKGIGDDSDSLAAIKNFKLTSGILLPKLGAARWQAGFYDHVVRVRGDWRNQAHYIAMNPVRGGLVESPFDYPFLGTIGGDLQDVILPIG